MVKSIETPLPGGFPRGAIRKNLRDGEEPALGVPGPGPQLVRPLANASLARGSRLELRAIVSLVPEGGLPSDH